MPQTGPRPVYKAPLAAPGAPAPGAASRPTPGRPVPGQPIFQRTARPQAPGSARPPLRPGERRPMHPTRVAPAGSRPLGVGPGAGLPPPGPTRPGSRPGGPARRPGQRYVPRGVKEGPMKGYTPPPRHDHQQRARADHAEHHDYRRNLGERPGREAGHSRQGCDCAAGGARRVRDHQSNARRGTGKRNGALLRSGYGSDHLRRTGCERYDRSNREQRGRRGSRAASAGGHDHGPRGSRQDDAAGFDPLDQCGWRRGGRHYAAYRRIQGCDHRQGVSGLRARDRVPGYARSRSVHAHAFARSESDRHRGAGHCGRRRRHAADD